MPYPLTQLNLLLPWSLFHPSAGTVLCVFLVIDLAFSFILLQVTQIILIQLISITVENYSKIQKVVV